MSAHSINGASGDASRATNRINNQKSQKELKTMKTLTSFRGLALGVLLALNLTSAPQAGDMIPAKYTASGKITSLVPLADPATVPLGTDFLYGTASIAGHGTMLGRYTLESEFLIHLEFDGTQFYSVSEGPWVATAANGDLLQGTFRHLEPMIVVDGQLVGSGVFTGTSEITGGTGRFEGATGSETTDGILIRQPDGLTLIKYTHDGFISSIGSLRRAN